MFDDKIIILGTFLAIGPALCMIICAYFYKYVFKKEVTPRAFFFSFKIYLALIIAIHLLGWTCFSIKYLFPLYTSLGTVVILIGCISMFFPKKIGFIVSNSTKFLLLPTLVVALLTLIYCILT